MVNYKALQEDEEILQHTLEKVRNGMPTGKACREISDHTLQHEAQDSLLIGDKTNPFIVTPKAQKGGCCIIS